MVLRTPHFSICCEAPARSVLIGRLALAISSGISELHETILVTWLTLATGKESVGLRQQQ